MTQLMEMMEEGNPLKGSAATKVFDHVQMCAREPGNERGRREAGPDELDSCKTEPGIIAFFVKEGVE